MLLLEGVPLNINSDSIGFGLWTTPLDPLEEIRSAFGRLPYPRLLESRGTTVSHEPGGASGSSFFFPVHFAPKTDRNSD